MATDGTLLTRMRAAVRGELDASTLAALRWANGPVYEELFLAERLVDAPLPEFGAGPPGVAAASHQLATWVAFVLETTGEHLIDAAEQASPGTVGYLPQPTFALAWQCLTAGQRWLLRAQRARFVDGYDLRREHVLPVLLPLAFTAPRYHPPAHLAALLDAGQAIRLRAEYGVFVLERSDWPGRPGPPERLAWLRRLLAEAAVAHDYVERLRWARGDAILRRFAMDHLCWAVNCWLLVGQLVAFPEVLDRYLPPPAGQVRYLANVLDGRPQVPQRRAVPAPIDLDELASRLPALPFDVRNPPLVPLAECADPAMWRRAVALLSDHSAASDRFCRCGRAAGCHYRLLATMSLVTAFLCGPGEPWPESMQILHRQIVAG